MTRNTMAKLIEARLGTDKIDGIEHIDRPTWWLRQMAAELGILENSFRDEDRQTEDRRSDNRQKQTADGLKV